MTQLNAQTFSRHYLWDTDFKAFATLANGQKGALASTYKLKPYLADDHIDRAGSPYWSFADKQIISFTSCLDTAKLATLFLAENFEEDTPHPSAGYFLECFEGDPEGTLMGMLAFFKKNLLLQGVDAERNLLGSLNILTHIDRSEARDAGWEMAMSSLSYPSEAVQERAVECFDNWGEPDAASALRAACKMFKREWLRTYARKVIKTLENKAGKNGVPGTEN